jgi:hypothetical protein
MGNMGGFERIDRVFSFSRVFCDCLKLNKNRYVDGLKDIWE